MALADEIRTETLGTPSIFPSRILTLPSGKQIEVRVPSAGAQEAIRRAATVVTGIGPLAKVDVDVAKLRAWRVALCCFIPGTQERVYGPEHVDDMISRPSVGGWFAECADAIGELVGEALEKGKGSSTTDKGSGS